MQIVKYPDDTSYAIAKRLEQEYTEEGIRMYTNRPRFLNDLTIRVNTYEQLWHLNQIVDSYNNNGVIPTITIPWLIDGQADRRFESNQSSGLKLVLKFLNSMKANFKIFHPHNAEVVQALMDDVEIIDNTEFIFDVLLEIAESMDYTGNDDTSDEIFNNESHLYDHANYPQNQDVGIYHYKLKDHLILMSSDAGGFKPLMKLCSNLNWKGETASASKSREYKDGKSILNQLIAETDFGGKDILIVDDICIYGGTFKGLATMLRERNCGKLYLAVSHITVQNHEKDNVFNYFDRVFTTNSKYDVYYERIDGSSGKEIKNLDIIKLF